MQFRAVCSKWNQKLTLSLSANNIDEARSLLHDQGYSIMEIKELSEIEVSGSNFFYFDVMLNGQLKSGKIQSDDIFKAYKKLYEDLGYDIIYIYTSEGMVEEQKKVITAKVKDGYQLYKQSLGINVNEKKLTEKENDEIEISPQVLKEIEQYNHVLDSTIEKIQNLILKHHTTITVDQKRELEVLVGSLIQTKWASNLGKLKNIVEQALTKIGKIESELIKNGIDGEKKKLLDETNSLLKQIGSSERITSEQKPTFDIGKALGGFLDSLQKKKSTIEQKKKVDTNSFIFYKNLRELNIYKENLNTTEILLLKALFKFQFSQVKRLLLKKKLLQQNITIIDNRIHNRNISYTKVVKGTTYYLDRLFYFFQKLTDILLYSLLLYVITYIGVQTLQNFHILTIYIQPHFFFYITLISIFTFFLTFFRSLISLFLFGWAFILIFIFLSLNF